MASSQQLILGQVPATGGGGGAYQISRSLRFNSADSAYLSRTPASAGNRQTFTYSFWIKRSKIGTLEGIIGTEPDTPLLFDSNDTLRVVWNVSTLTCNTTQVFRDLSAWYHIVCVADTTNATAADRVRIYINGVRVTAFSAAPNITQNANFDVNTAQATYIGRNRNADPRPISAYFAEFHFIDGQALTPSSFGQTNSTTGVWEPIAYTGTYGTNGFYLNFSDNSGTTSTTLGKDYSGNGNNWTPNNFSVTAGAGNDSLVDTPTPYGTDTGAGGEVRGNYATLNPLVSSVATLANGNLDWSQGATAYRYGLSTIAIPLTGKYIVEVVFNSTPTTNLYNTAGVINSTGLGYLTTTMVQAGSGFYGVNDASSTYGQSFVQNGTRQGSITVPSGTIIQLLIDRDNNQLTFTKNGTLQTGTGSTVTIPSGVDLWAVVGDWGASGSVNFGQRPFAYTAPSGFKALVTTNLPEPTVVQGDDYFNTVLYTGNGSTQSITGVGFQPDLVWLKNRVDATWWHNLFDVIRGVGNRLASNDTAAEAFSANSLTAFGSDGFSVGSDNTPNDNGDAYVAWNWKANGAGSTNTAGTITSTVSVNTTSGFSIVTYTGNGTSGATVGHGLGVAPSMIIVKNRGQSVSSWDTYHKFANANPQNGLLRLNTTAAFTSASNIWNNTAPTSTVFTLGSSASCNANTINMVAYCFAEVAGYSAFGSYTGNGSADGPFVYTGFRPAFVMIKLSSSAGQSWLMVDATRDTYNVAGLDLYANLSNAEANEKPVMDLLSNGFKARNTYTVNNTSGATYIYMAFASNPFKYSLAR